MTDSVPPRSVTPWPLPAALGVMAGILLALGNPWAALPAAALAAALWRSFRPLLLVAALLAGLGGFLSARQVSARPDPLAPWLGTRVTLQGHWDGQFLHLKDPVGGVVLAPRPAVPPGEVRVSGLLLPPDGPRTPGGFDQAGWLRTQGGLLTPAPTAVLVAARVREARAEGGLRGWFRRGLGAGLNGRQAALMAAIELGERNDLSRENFGDGSSVRDAFNHAGLAHLMALSGQNVALIVGAVVLLLGLVRAPLWARYAVPIGLLVVYLGGLVSVSPSITRAVVMGIAVLLGLLTGRGRPDPLGTVALAALACLLLYPLWLLDLGFQLSFLAVLALTLSGKLADRLPPRWPRPLRLTLSATVLAELGTLPLIASTFNQLPLVGLPANLLAEGLMALLVPLGFAAGMLGPFAAPVNLLVAPLASLLLALAEAFGRFPTLAWGHIGPGGFAAYAVAALGGVLWLLGRVRGQVALALLLGCALLSALPGRLHPPRDLIFLDVGQGDATLLRADGFHLLVDGGGSVGSDYDVGGRTVVPALRNLGVRSLDVVVATHADTDHIEGLSSVLDSLPVGELWIGQRKAGDPVLDAVLRAAERHHVPVREVRRGDHLSVADVNMTVLWPAGKVWSTADNDNSVVLTIESRGWRTALLGDLPDPAETLLGVGKLDLLKTAHHGSRHSTSPDFLAQTRPADALISVGRNTYGHPHAEVLARLQAAGVRVWRTDRSGTVRWPLP